MPGLRRVPDPEATATATAPWAAKQKQAPPRSPRLVHEQDGDPGEEMVAAPSPCSACRTNPSEKTPPRASPLVDGGTAKKTEANHAVPSPRDASTPPPRALGQPAPTTPTFHKITDGAPAPRPTYAPAAPRIKPVPGVTAGPVEKTVSKPAAYPRVAPPPRPCSASAQARYAIATPTARASSAPVPFDWPIPYRATFPRPYAPAPAPAPAAAVPGATLSHQLPRTATEEALARTQRQGSAALKRKREVSVDIAVKMIKERALGISDEPVRDSIERDIMDSIKAFASHNPLESDIIRFALLSIPRGPQSFLQCEKFSDGNHAARGATCTHKSSRDAIDSAVKAFGFEVGSELMRFGSIKSDPWNTICEQNPLILRDIDIVRGAQVRGTRVNVVQRITDLLQSHPGPIAYFRIDSCQIDYANRTRQMEEWFSLLRKKQIKEVVFVNCSWPSDMFEFSITNLNCQSLHKISLSFMKLTDIFLEHAANLMVIDLCCCSLTPTDLYALSYECKNLQVLRIGMYKGDVIRLNSISLEVLKIWHCTVRKVAVQNALKLQRVLVASVPNKPSMKVGIWIEDAPVLSAASFNLSLQSVSICDLRAKTDNANLDSIRKLVLHFTFKVEKEKKELLKFMESSKALKELTLWRNDGKYQYEFLDAKVGDWSFHFKDLSCLKFHLEVFMIQDCKGGEVEFAISSAVLEHSTYLKQLVLEGDIFQDVTMLIQAKTNLEEVTRASKSAILTIKSGFSDCNKKITSFLEEV